MDRRTPPNLNDPRVLRFLDWLCTIPADRTPHSQNALAAELDLSQSTLSHWKDDADFLHEWERRYLRTIGSVGRQQEILQALFETATDRTDPRQVLAAKTYLDVIGKAKPQQARVTKNAQELTDAQLYEVLAERAEQAISERG